jgi:hypothetical protein
MGYEFSNCSDGAEELGLNISPSGITTFFISNECNKCPFAAEK